MTFVMPEGKPFFKMRGLVHEVMDINIEAVGLRTRCELVAKLVAENFTSELPNCFDCITEHTLRKQQEDAEATLKASGITWGAYQAFAANTKAIVPWPKDKPLRYNGSGEPCDAWTGPCCCGATHLEGK